MKALAGVPEITRELFERDVVILDSFKSRRIGAGVAVFDSFYSGQTSCDVCRGHLE